MRVCIVGTSRCGTTLLRNLLHQHPELSVFNETHWLPRMYEFYGQQKVRWRELLAVAEKTTWDTGKDLLTVNLVYSKFDNREALLDAIAAELSARSPMTIQEFTEVLADVLFQGPVNWGDKTPDYGYYMELVQRLWPEARFVHMVREGISTGQSMSKHSGCQLMTAAGYDNWCSLSYDGLYRQYNRRKLPLAAYVASWRRRMARIRDESTRLRRQTYLEVRYEDLISDPKPTLSRLADFLGLPLRVPWLDSVAGQVNPRKLPVQADWQVLAQMTPEDLLAVNEGPGQRHFKQFATRDELLAAIQEGASRLSERQWDCAAELGLSIIASRAAHKEEGLSARAIDLIAQSLSGVGEYELARRWKSGAGARTGTQHGRHW